MSTSDDSSRDIQTFKFKGDRIALTHPVLHNRHSLDYGANCCEKLFKFQ